jgi:hypothetical protein
MSGIVSIYFFKNIAGFMALAVIHPSNPAILNVYY